MSDNSIMNAFLASKKKKLGRIPRPKFPRRVESEYVDDLAIFARALEEAVREMILPHIDGLVAEASIVKPEAGTDVRKDDIGVTIDRLVENVRNRLAEASAVAGLAVQRIAGKVSDFNFKDTRKSVEKAVGVVLSPREPWLADQISLFISQNVELIKNVQDDVLTQIKGVLSRGVASGKRVETIRKEITGTGVDRGIFQKLRTRTTLIARDQVGKMNANLTRLRQTELGVRRYIWRTSRDERVRLTHTVKEGKIFSWDDPPADTGHPGEDFNCRCTAESYFPDLLDDDFKQDRKQGQEWKRKHLKELREKKKSK